MRIVVGLASLAIFAVVPASVAAATVSVECGLFRDYIAPDPIAPAAGSITFGLSGSPETIAPDAMLVPPTDTALPSLQGGAPTCLTVTRDGGVITALAFAPSGPIVGTVILVPDLFGSGQDAYVIADRVFAPTDLIATNDGLAALIKTAADSGSTLSITFQIDVTTGVPTRFNATTTFSGIVVLLPGGDIQVGAATLPSAVIDGVARADLEEAADLDVPATVVVDGIGTLDQSGGVAVDIALTVGFVPPAVVAPAPTPTRAPALPDTAARPLAPGWLHFDGFVIALVAVVGGIFVTVRRSRSMR